ncbi:1,3-beta-glucanosyltransferase [Friedmanniomyces endolithicus]|nr:1,3-beta-glucanosyltransferase [Friedmanniomyces endolithicus]
MKCAIAIVAAAAALASAVATPAELVARASSSATATSSGSLPTVTPGGSSGAADPIANVAGCTRDIVEFKKLGINTVRVYTVDNTANHDQCMAALAAAGIYLALDVNTPHYAINRADPAPSYNSEYLQSVFATIDAFAKYDNTLLFFSGNEVINDDNTTNCAPYVKAVTRDMKQYIGSRGYRSIPVGYSAADVESNRYEMASYMNCGTADQRSDFFAFNDYSWCDPSSSYTISGWDQKVAQYSNYSIPLFLSEYGCIKNARNFEEVASLYGTNMTPVYSGGLVYEYSEEGNHFGLVQISGSSVTEASDFAALASELSQNQPSGDGGYKSSGSPSTCPAQSSTWEVTAFTGEELPAIPSGAAAYMKNGAGTGPGLSGSGSMSAGGSSTGTATPGSGSVTAVASGGGSSASASSAAQALVAGELGFAPLVCGVLVLVSSLVGAALL